MPANQPGLMVLTLALGQPQAEGFHESKSLEPSQMLASPMSRDSLP